MVEWIRNNREKFLAGRLELRKKLRAGMITPQENGHLLKKLEKECLEEFELSMKSIFGSDDKEFASWYSGTIWAPYGKLLEYVHAGYASTYEFELIIDVKEGIILGERIKKNEVPPKRESAGDEMRKWMEDINNYPNDF